MARVTVIGAGFSGLSAACYLAKSGHTVTIAEKNSTIGGRARAFNSNGFMFDMGPSWYWMPDVFERFFNDFGKTAATYYDLKLLDPGFQIIFSENNVLKVPKNKEELFATFESLEKGSAARLKELLDDAAFKYETGIGKMVQKPSFSWMEYAVPDVITSLARLQMLQPVSSVVRKLFKDYRLIALLEFPVLFLGASAKHIPALYTLMNYAALELGTWYPMGGMVEIVRGMESLARELGVKITTDCAVQHITTGADGYVSSLETTLGRTPTDAVIASADYHHVEQQLLDAPLRRYNEPYWDKRALAPSCVIYYLGINRKLDKLIHHNLFFDADMDQHIDDIYTQPEWPENPLFYACCPSKTDSSVAPVGMENLFILIPVAAGMKENEQLLDRYYDIAMARLEKYCGHSIKEHVVVRHNYSTQNFTADYNAYKGNAYGLANTLAQTAVLKPSLRNKKIKNMFYAGQLTVPGPGVPPALISGKIAAQQIDKLFKNTRP